MLPIATLSVLLAACGGSKAPPEAAADAEPAVKSDIPDDAKSAAFAKRLIALEISDFKPTDGSGAKFVYTSMDFQAGNSWTAEGYVEAMDEQMECKEQGTWAMEPAESNTTATMTWTLLKTSCVGRDNGVEQRLKMTITDDGRFKVAFR